MPITQTYIVNLDTEVAFTISQWNTYTQQFSNIQSWHHMLVTGINLLVLYQSLIVDQLWRFFLHVPTVMTQDFIIINISSCSSQVKLAFWGLKNAQKLKSLQGSPSWVKKIYINIMGPWYSYDKWPNKWCADNPNRHDGARAQSMLHCKGPGYIPSKAFLCFIMQWISGMLGR